MEQQVSPYMQDLLERAAQQQQAPAGAEEGAQLSPEEQAALEQQAAADQEAALAAEQAAAEGGVPAEQAALSPEEQALAAQQQQQQAPVDPNQILAEQTGGKIQSIEQMNQLLDEIEALRTKPSVSDAQMRMLSLMEANPEGFAEIIRASKTDVDALSPGMALWQDFVRDGGIATMSPEAQKEGFLLHVKKMLGANDVVIDTSDMDTLGLDDHPFFIERLGQLASEAKPKLKEYYQGLVPAFEKELQAKNGNAATDTRSLSEEDQAYLRDAVSSFDKYSVSLGEGDGAEMIELAVAEIPGFSQLAAQIQADPIGFVEEQFSTRDEAGNKSIDVNAILEYAALKAGLPAVLSKHGDKVGTRRYEEGLAAGTGQAAGKVEAALIGANQPAAAKTQDDIIREKTDEIYLKMSGR